MLWNFSSPHQGYNRIVKRIDRAATNYIKTKDRICITNQSSQSLTAPADFYVKLDFNRKSSDHKDSPVSLFVGVLLKRHPLDLPAI